MIDSFVICLFDALTCVTQGDYERAKAICREMTTQLPAHANALTANGLAAYHSNSISGLKESIILFEHAIAADPDNATSKNCYASALERIGRHAEAKRVRQELLSPPTATQHFEALLRIIELLLAENHTVAEAAMRALLDNLPLQALAFHLLGCQAAISGNFSAATTWFLKSVKDRPEEIRFHENLAIVLDAAGDSQTAQKVRKSIREEPFLATAVRTIEDLSDWAAASNYEIRTIDQDIFTAPTRLERFPEIFNDISVTQESISRKPGIAVKAQNFKVIYWRWLPPAEGPDGSHIMIPLSRNNDILVSQYFLYAYPFIRDFSENSSYCTLDATAFITSRIHVTEECFFLGGIPEFSDWLAGDFPKLQALEGASLPDEIPIYTIKLKVWMRETLEAIDLLTRVRELASPHPLPSCTLLEFDQAWIAGGFSMRSNFEFMRRQFSKHTSSLPSIKCKDPLKRIYLRSPPGLHGSKRISNEEEVYSYLVKHGFEVVYPEKLNIQEKARLFGNEAAMIFSGPGSRCFNFFAFAHPASILIMPIAKELLDAARTLDNWPVWNLPYLDQTVFVKGSLLESPPADMVELFNASARYAIVDVAAAIDEAANIFSLSQSKCHVSVITEKQSVQ